MVCEQRIHAKHESNFNKQCMDHLGFPSKLYVQSSTSNQQMNSIRTNSILKAVKWNQIQFGDCQHHPRMILIIVQSNGKSFHWRLLLLMWEASEKSTSTRTKALHPAVRTQLIQQHCSPNENNFITSRNKAWHKHHVTQILKRLQICASADSTCVL